MFVGLYLHAIFQDGHTEEFIFFAPNKCQSETTIKFQMIIISYYLSNTDA